MVSTLPDCREDKNYVNNPEYKNKLQINCECPQRVSCSELRGNEDSFLEEVPPRRSSGCLSNTALVSPVSMPDSALRALYKRTHLIHTISRKARTGVMSFLVEETEAEKRLNHLPEVT